MGPATARIRGRTGWTTTLGENVAKEKMPGGLLILSARTAARMKGLAQIRKRDRERPGPSDQDRSGSNAREMRPRISPCEIERGVVNG